MALLKRVTAPTTRVVACVADGNIAVWGGARWGMGGVCGLSVPPAPPSSFASTWAAPGVSAAPVTGTLCTSVVTVECSTGVRHSSTASEDIIRDNPYNNIPSNIADKIGTNLHQREDHPLHTIKSIIAEYFASSQHDVPFKLFDNESPVVSTQQCFDDMRVPKDHVSRAPSDTFYVDADIVLRPHTSAHQIELMRAGHNAFLCVGDVYRRDSIDGSHYPVFHQMEGVRIYDDAEFVGMSDEAVEELVISRLKRDLEGMAKALFGDVSSEWVDAYFPFTHPSLELEILFADEWLEVLGCGKVHPDIMKAAGLEGRQAYAFGLGLERLAMVRFGIPDIRLFWTDDERFHSQFRGKREVTFVPYSKYPPVFKDVALWIPSGYHENDFCSHVRDVCGDIVEQVELIDEFDKPGKGTSWCFRITYRSMDRSLTNKEVDEIQETLREVLEASGLELR